MKGALFVVGGWDGHEPKLTAEIFASSLRAEVPDRDDGYAGRFLDAEKLAKFDLIVPVWTMVRLPTVRKKGYWMRSRAVWCGGWHGCMADSFRNNTEYQFMVGGHGWRIPAISSTTA